MPVTVNPPAQAATAAKTYLWDDPELVGAGPTRGYRWWDATNQCFRVKSATAPENETDGRILMEG
jgi:hypothetical protein